MIKLSDILLEVAYNEFEAMVRVIYNEDVDSNQIGDLLRGLPGVLTVTNAGGYAENSTAVYKVKLISQKNGEEAFAAFKENAINKYSFLSKVEVGTETIEEK